MWHNLKHALAAILTLVLGAAIGLVYADELRPDPRWTGEEGGGPRTAEVEPASREQRDLVRKALEHGVEFSEAYALRSRGRRDGYFVSARLFGPGLEQGPAAVWLVGGEPAHPDVVVPINHVAQRFSRASGKDEREEVTDLTSELLPFKAYVERQSGGGLP